MPSFTNQTFSSYFNRILQISQTTNVGADATTRAVETGDAAKTSLSISDDVLSVQPQNDDTTGTFLVKNQSSSNILSVDTTNSLVKAGASQVNTLTLTKEMGLFDFSPTTSVHNPLIASNMMFSDSGEDFIQDTSMFGNGTDPATTLDLSSDGTPMTAVS